MISFAARSPDSIAPLIQAIQTEVCSPAKCTCPSARFLAWYMLRILVEPGPTPAAAHPGVVLPDLVGGGDHLVRCQAR
jgi:hypothetical protein